MCCRASRTQKSRARNAAGPAFSPTPSRGRAPATTAREAQGNPAGHRRASNPPSVRGQKARGFARPEGVRAALRPARADRTDGALCLAALPAPNQRAHCTRRRGSATHGASAKATAQRVGLMRRHKHMKK
ncbi:uncharacterized protein Tco025E_09252 [Trypanosoma conorhini]|uniref:Uncharacterized protein n=1 Tax=Trypanosoma conorhini TaxID=83891 RepID=A0A3R7KNT5_9TRYP|nr:uncharacterized protein Tco025E_09252 [Trypanosoma conorhini]RNE98307.1 hypothetical protein Tco025E_09252 [Trypanosoma conorhini]